MGLNRSLNVNFFEKIHDMTRETFWTLGELVLNAKSWETIKTFSRVCFWRLFPFILIAKHVFYPVLLRFKPQWFSIFYFCEPKHHIIPKVCHFSSNLKWTETDSDSIKCPPTSPVAPTSGLISRWSSSRHYKHVNERLSALFHVRRAVKRRCGGWFKTRKWRRVCEIYNSALD